MKTDSAPATAAAGASVVSDSAKGWLLRDDMRTCGNRLVRDSRPEASRTGPGVRSVRASRSPMVTHLNASRDAAKHSNGCREPTPRMTRADARPIDRADAGDIVAR
ncbi:hypothetical protein GCM10009573_17080 [Agromyces bracchium]